jgi:hypothetical protein
MRTADEMKARTLEQLNIEEAYVKEKMREMAASWMALINEVLESRYTGDMPTTWAMIRGLESSGLGVANIIRVGEDVCKKLILLGYRAEVENKGDAGIYVRVSWSTN